MSHKILELIAEAATFKQDQHLILFKLENRLRAFHLQDLSFPLTDANPLSSVISARSNTRYLNNETGLSRF